jgi:hypothetical protein
MLTSVELKPQRKLMQPTRLAHFRLSALLDTSLGRGRTSLCSRALDGAGERVGRTEALAEDPAEVEHEVEGETWVH